MDHFVWWGVKTAQSSVSAFCDETGAESAKSSQPSEQAGSHEARTKDLRGFIMYSPHNL